VYNLCPSFLWSISWPSTSYSIHFFTQSLSSFCRTYPYHRNLFCCSTEIMSSNPSLSLNPLHGTVDYSFYQLPYFFFFSLTASATSSFHHHSLCMHGPFDNPHVTCAVSIIIYFICCQCSFTSTYFHSASSASLP